jgi:nicotinamidase-related amidase
MFMRSDRSLLLIVDFQTRLMPSIEGAADVVANARRLIAAADLMAVPVVVTEQNAKGIGATVPELGVGGRLVVAKQTFGSCATPAFLTAIGHAGGGAVGVQSAPDIILAGCEAHVCVMQTALGLLEIGRRVFLVRDCVGARRAESKETAIARMAPHGAEIVTTEMVIFEWLRSSDHPQFKAALALVK